MEVSATCYFQLVQTTDLEQIFWVIVHIHQHLSIKVVKRMSTNAEIMLRVKRRWLLTSHCSLLCTNAHLWHTKWMPHAPNLWPVHHWDAQDLSWMHLISLARIEALVSVSWRVKSQKRYVQKSSTSQEKAHEVQNSGITRQASTNMVCVYVYVSAFWDWRHLMWPYHNSWWPPPEK